ncbi:PqqD family protein [Rothia sp. LK2588]|uniref:PqqD family protein n=1 Tax=Rothia sp. LK2588 TaxID=3114369 RepID=UPI0034CEFF4E
MSIDPAAQLAQAAHTAFVVEDQENDAADTVIHIAHLDEPNIVMVQGSGSTMWELLSEPMTMGRLTERVAEIYGEDVATVAPGVQQFVESLVAQDLVAVSA